MSLPLCTNKPKSNVLASVFEPETKALAYLSGTSVTKKKKFYSHDRKQSDLVQ